MRASGGGGGGGGGGGLRSHEARRDEACGEERRDGTNNKHVSKLYCRTGCGATMGGGAAAPLVARGSVRPPVGGPAATMEMGRT